MSSSKPPDLKKFPDDSIEKQVYKIVENYSQHLPIVNDRNRLGFSLYKYIMGQGDSPLTTLRNAKVKVVGISVEELAGKISAEIAKIHK